MEGKLVSKRREDITSFLGGKKLVSSFLSANNDDETFGSFRVPKSFHIEFGKELASGLVIHCNLLVWKVKYDAELRKIFGMGTFMKYYGVKIYYLLRFDYYGEGLFVIRIFKDTAIECSYPTMDLQEFLQNAELQNLKKDQYVINVLSLDYEKVCALWNFNAYHNIADYFEIKITNVDIDPNLENLILKDDLENLYKDWADGSTLLLRFFDTDWEIGIRWINGKCTFSRGWNVFAKKTELEVGDTLVFFKITTPEDNIINVCLFKAKDITVDNLKETMEWNISFFKVLSEPCLDRGVVVVPKCIKDNYGILLSSKKQIQVAGKRCFIYYDFEAGFLGNLKTFFEEFNLRPKETVVFTVDNSNVLNGRIFQEDGKEINYSNRSLECSSNGGSNWFWAVAWDDENDNQFGDGEAIEEIENNGSGNDQALMDVDVGGLPQFIIVVKHEHYKSAKMKLPDKILLEYGDVLPCNITLQFPTGRERNILYNETEKSFVSMNRFIKELIKCSASIIVFRYKGHGIFQVNTLNDEGSEVLPLRSNATVPGNVGDYNSGIGWKFMLFGIGSVFEAGEFEIPETFQKKLGRIIPNEVIFVLKNGTKLNGYYSKAESKMSLLEKIESSNFEKKDSLLFTYQGNGTFEIVVFDRYKVEKLLPDTPSATGAMECLIEGQTAGIHNEWHTSGMQTNQNSSEKESEVESSESEDQDSENVEDDLMDMLEMPDVPMEFTVSLTTSNVNRSGHGVYIPKLISPHNRSWEAGEEVTLRTAAGTWIVKVLFSNGVARFSAGWNGFAKDNKVKKNQRLTFTLVEEPEGIVFNIHIP